MVRTIYARPVSYGFDPNQPGARRLLEWARQLGPPEPTTRVELLEPISLADEDRPLHKAGDQVDLPADIASFLIAHGAARAIE